MDALKVHYINQSNTSHMSFGLAAELSALRQDLDKAQAHLPAHIHCPE